MDEAWRYETEHEIARLRKQAAAAREARTQANGAKASARELFLAAPAALVGAQVGDADPRPTRAAWAAWLGHPDEDGPEGLQRLAEHIEQAWPRLNQAVTVLTATTEAELQVREDRWAPIAADVAAWCKRASDAEVAARIVPSLKAAINWLKAAADDIRNERLAPLGDQARTIWAQLRQESNVDLGAIRLTGSGPRRQVDVMVTVDGSPSAALGVMSQGEVNALALSIFLPRATLPASPFRFLVIDDPVQAMDPAKVEGLARVLADVSRSRQVLVFTHDDRLPEAVRRLGIPARIVEVTRRPGSIVQIRPALTPVERCLEDAQALCADEALPEAVAARVIPGLCRLAVEATFTQAIRRKQLQAGKRHADVEAAIEAADSLNKRAALAMFGDARVVALLTRQALEQALNEFWEAAPTTARLSQCPHRSQLACLPSYLNADTAREIGYIWGALSDSCHYHAYELAPTASELTGWINAVAGLMTAISDKEPAPPVPAGSAPMPLELGEGKR